MLKVPQSRWAGEWRCRRVSALHRVGTAAFSVNLALLGGIEKKKRLLLALGFVSSPLPIRGGSPRNGGRSHI